MLRALTRADAPGLTTLLAGIEAVDATGEHFDEDDVADELADASVDLARDTLTVVGPDGSLLGWTAVRASSTVTDVDRVWLEGGVLPSRRGAGLGRRLLEWAEGRGRELHAARHPGLAGELFVRVPATVPSQEALVRAAGYEPARYWYGMKPGAVVSAAADPGGAGRAARGDVVRGAGRGAPAGARRGVRRPLGLDPAGRAALDAVVHRLPWVPARAEPARARRRPDRRIPASYFFPADAEATGVREAYIGQVGTLRPWRRRGLGGLLLATGLAAARAGGYAQAALTVDSGNPTGALGLYERAGFVVDHSSVTWAKPVG